MSTSSKSVPAWDLPTLVFHWALVVLVAGAWGAYEFSELLGDPLLKWHRNLGLAVLVVLMWRLLWGVFGSSTSRFSTFAASPLQAVGYARAMLRGEPRSYLGHNPAGTIVVLALLAPLVTQASLGLFSVEHNDLTAGPLYLFIDEAARKEATRWHNWLFQDVILIIIGLHIAANLAYTLGLRQPLIQAMVHGRKPAKDYADAQRAEIVGRPILRALVCLTAATLIVIGGIWAVGGRLL